jgi:hypothetical protein
MNIGPVRRVRVAAIAAAALLSAAATAYAHGGRPGHVDEGPASPMWITIIMVAAWIVIAFGIVLFVLRLIRRKSSKEQGDKREKA